jgi:hypothetical protein
MNRVILIVGLTVGVATLIGAAYIKSKRSAVGRLAYLNRGAAGPARMENM